MNANTLAAAAGPEHRPLPGWTACLAGATDVRVAKQASWGATRDNIIHDLSHDRPYPADPIARQWTV
jgi:hypothetical protein